MHTQQLMASSAPSSAPLHSPPLIPKFQAPPSPPEAPGLVPKYQAPPSPPEAPGLVPKYQAPPSPPEPPSLLPRNIHRAPAASPTPDQPPPKKLHGAEIIGIAFLAFAFCIAVGVIIFAVLYKRRSRRQQDAQQLPTEQQEQRPEVELPLAPSTSRATTTDDGLGYQQHEIQPGFIPGMHPDAIATLRQISYVPTPILPGKEFDHICCMCREPYFATDRLVILEPCHHTAHTKCACRALPTRGACPICEAAVLPYRPLPS